MTSTHEHRVIATITGGPVGMEELSVPLRTRLTPTIDDDLARIEAYFRGRGYRHVNRSHLVRVALESFNAEILAAIPAIQQQPINTDRESPPTPAP